ncbi:hypothetical protein LCGC14_0746950 [marine sediment metagenome]|uniref:Uncharacterized protein n=1 Tax=marine sediment metagenome TaxID=412755 RepID=A0A0F9Q9C0_9ZZZZ
MTEVAKAAEQIVKTGVVPTNTGSLSASNNYVTPNDGRLFLHVINGGGSTCNVTIAANKLVDGLTVPDRTVAVLAGTDQMIGPFDKDVYNDANDLISVTFDFITTVTLAAMRF